RREAAVRAEVERLDGDCRPQERDRGDAVARLDEHRGAVLERFHVRARRRERGLARRGYGRPRDLEREQARIDLDLGAHTQGVFHVARAAALTRAGAPAAGLAFWRPLLVARPGRAECT